MGSLVGHLLARRAGRGSGARVQARDQACAQGPGARSTDDLAKAHYQCAKVTHFISAVWVKFQTVFVVLKSKKLYL